MSVKIVHEDTFKTILSAVNKLCDFVKPTFGPVANKVIISRPIYRMVIDDGVAIARDFELNDEAEDAVVKIVKEVAIRTNDRVGDGTTSSLIILQAIMNEIAKLNVRSGRKIVEELKRGVEEAKNQLLKKAKKISTKEELEMVAKVAFDNPKIARVVAELLHKIGKDGVVTMDNSNTMETTSEHTNGVELKQGFISPYMINDSHRNEAVLEKPYILLTSYRLTNANDVIGIMNKLIEKGKRELLLICDNAENDALATMVVNRMEGKFLAVAVQAPQGEAKRQLLEDLAILTGATLFTEVKGNRLDNAEITDLGRADRAIIRNNQTIIVNGKGVKLEIERTKSRIRDELLKPIKDHERADLEMRLARFSNGIAVIKVGAPTESEAKALKYKVEDTIHATKSALRSGIVCGAGIALAELETSSPILNKALKAPMRELDINMGLDDLVLLDPGKARNFVTGEAGDYFKVGVIDPVEILIAGIESAVSVASILCTTHGILVEEKPKEK